MPSGSFRRHRSRGLQRCTFHSVDNLSASRVTWIEQFTTFHRHHFRTQAGTGHPGVSVECRPEAEGQVKPEGLGRQWMPRCWVRNTEMVVIAHQVCRGLGAPTAEELASSLIFYVCWIIFSVPSPRHIASVLHLVTTLAQVGPSSTLGCYHSHLTPLPFNTQRVQQQTLPSYSIKLRTSYSCLLLFSGPSCCP